MNQNMSWKKEVSQEKFIQYAIMDAILNQIEKEKQERVLSLDLESKSYTERSVSYGVSNRIIDIHIFVMKEVFGSPHCGFGFLDACFYLGIFIMFSGI